MSDDSRILTVPDELDEVEAVVPIANERLALPDIDARTGSVRSVTLLHDGAGGLIELRGRPLAAPTVRIDGESVATTAWTLHLDDPLLPTWRAVADGVELAWTLACPPGRAGAVLELTATVTGPAARHVELSISGQLLEPSLHVFSARAIDGPHHARFDAWSDALTVEVSTGLPVVALALRAIDGGRPRLSPPTPAEVAEDDGQPLPVSYHHQREATLAGGGSTALTVLLGAARERDGAALACIDLARTGVTALHTATRGWQDARRGPELDDPALATVRDRNRLFSLTFAAGRTIDSDELVLVTSRSPRYYVSGAHWSRDSLRWALPAVLAVDPSLAADWLRTAFSRYARNPGVHALYLDGTVLYPGFELDEAAAFPLALAAYLEVTGDTTLVGEPPVAAGLAAVDAALAAAHDATSGLYATELLSSDDPAPLPFGIYANGLTMAALRARAQLHRAAPEADGEASARRCEQAADALLAAIRAHGVVDGPFGPMFAGATDGQGRHARFDEPPGSLELLAHLGVSAADDPVFEATVRWIWSRHNPHGPPEGRYATPVCEHAGNPWLLAVGNALLRGDERWLDRLPQLPLDAGLACETFDAATGEPRTGLAFATCAGWLAHAIDVATGPRTATPGGERTTAAPDDAGAAR